MTSIDRISGNCAQFNLQVRIRGPQRRRRGLPGSALCTYGARAWRPGVVYMCTCIQVLSLQLMQVAGTVAIAAVGSGATSWIGHRGSTTQKGEMARAVNGSTLQQGDHWLGKRS